MDFESFYDYGSFDDYNALKLPYKTTNNSNFSRQFSMIIILPKETKGLPSLIHKFRENPNLLSREHLNLENTMITSLQIPRFKLSHTFLPSEDIKKLGLTLPFKHMDELNGIVDDDEHVSLGVSRITQHTQIQCNEKGTEVVACTYDW
ncbi:serpin-ZXA-like [Spinacia oleracea]|uniref:Serpin-ZXA-like n=1 Tax=Spinacia oleracea TaxID=3562 RepID=A0ABM3R7N8_SPIOL|nr:serpin-ZXA-like [Spinacia oleracea]